MKLKVLTENIRLVPKVCAELEGEFALIFRQPTQGDIIDITTIAKPRQVITVMSNLFVGFENAPEIEGENGKVVDYETLEEFLSYSHPVIAGVTSDIVSLFNELREKAFNIEKK